MKLRYDEGELHATLRQFPLPQRVAFAAACAERQVPFYRTFSGKMESSDPALLENVLDKVWKELGGKEIPPAELERYLERVESLLPRDEVDWTEEAPFAENAVAAVLYTLRCRMTGNPQEAVWAARQAYNALDTFVCRQSNVDINDPEAERTIRNHQIIQAELQRQKEDLELLQRSPERIDELRQRAEKAAAEFFGPSS